MRLLICGDRNWADSDMILDALLEYVHMPDIVIIHGAARGADRIAGAAAKELGMKVEEYPADWKRYKYSAGPIRNQVMLDAKPDHVIAFHNSIETSKGTGHMVHITKKSGVSHEVRTSKKC